MNPVPFTWMLMAFALLFGTGNVTGGLAVYKLWSYSTMQATISKLKEDNQRFRTALGFSREIDDENIKVELGDDEIYEAILKQAGKTPAAPRRWFPRLCPPATPDPNPECVPADIMQSIGRLR